jgi:hypothetical protein
VPEAATFSLTATSTSIGDCGANCGSGDSLTQFGYSGTFSFVETAADSNPGANLLSGTFAVTGSPATTGAQFTGNIGSTSGSFTGSATAGNLNQLVLASAFLNFAGQTQETASFSLSSLIPNFDSSCGLGGCGSNTTAYPAAGTFNAAGAGTFSSNPGPAAAPEPATFSLIGGALLLGLGAFRRKRFFRA